MVFGGLVAVSLVLAAVFVAAGAWPVLPYSLLEIGVVACAYVWSERHAGDWERLTVLGDRVVVEQVKGSTTQRREFNRYWLRVDVEPAAHGRAPRVFLRGGGASWEFGHALPAQERLAVARELRQRTGMR